MIVYEHNPVQKKDRPKPASERVNRTRYWAQPYPLFNARRVEPCENPVGEFSLRVIANPYNGRTSLTVPKGRPGIKKPHAA
jgi:hypothetical protein